MFSGCQWTMLQMGQEQPYRRDPPSWCGSALSSGAGHGRGASSTIYGEIDRIHLHRRARRTCAAHRGDARDRRRGGDECTGGCRPGLACYAPHPRPAAPGEEQPRRQRRAGYGDPRRCCPASRRLVGAASWRDAGAAEGELHPGHRRPGVCAGGGAARRGARRARAQGEGRPRLGGRRGAHPRAAGGAGAGCGATPTPTSAWIGGHGPGPTGGVGGDGAARTARSRCPSSRSGESPAAKRRSFAADRRRLGVFAARRWRKDFDTFDINTRRRTGYTEVMADDGAIARRARASWSARRRA